MATINDWLQASQVSGSGNTTITLVASNNTELQERLATLTISGQTKSATFNVSQEAYFEVKPFTPQSNTISIANIGCYYDDITDVIGMTWDSSIPSSQRKVTCSIEDDIDWIVFNWGSGTQEYFNYGGQLGVMANTGQSRTIRIKVKHSYSDYYTYINLTQSGNFSINQIPIDEIWYKSINGDVHIITDSAYKEYVVSNTYANGVGKIKLSVNISGICSLHNALQSTKGNTIYFGIFFSPNAIYIGEGGSNMNRGFNHYYALREFYFGSVTPSYSDSYKMLFSYCTNLLLVDGVLNNTTSNNGTPSDLFNRAYSLVNVDKAISGLEYIGSYAFCNMNNLKTIVISNKTKSVRDSAFEITDIGARRTMDRITIGSNVEYFMRMYTTYEPYVKEYYCYPSTAPNTIYIAGSDDSETHYIHYPQGSDYSSWINKLQRSGDWIGVADL